jgi:hypothetical protein
VARLYAKFLTSIGALPGSHFEETTAARLANDGVSRCKKLIENVLNNGGGALFIDEAYQLASGQKYGGTQVLDFLLPEIENLTGKMVVILAGYSRQMKAFFAHNPGLPDPRKTSTLDLTVTNSSERLIKCHLYHDHYASDHRGTYSEWSLYPERKPERKPRRNYAKAEWD